MTDDHDIDNPDAWDEPIRTPAGPPPKRNVLLTISLDDAQFALASAAAARHGMRLTEFAKDRLLMGSEQRTYYVTFPGSTP